MVIKQVKEPLEIFGRRALYRIEEHYDNGEIYHGFYVESLGETSRRAQAYRFKTVKGDKEFIEDKDAFSRARETLIYGFSF